MTAKQMELFSEYMAEKPAQPAVSSFVVVVEGKSYILTDHDLDNLEKKLGEWKNDDGVSFWWLLRRLKNDGVKRVNLI